MFFNYSINLLILMFLINLVYWSYLLFFSYIINLLILMFLINLVYMMYLSYFINFNLLLDQFLQSVSVTSIIILFVHSTSEIYSGNLIYLFGCLSFIFCLSVGLNFKGLEWCEWQPYSEVKGYKMKYASFGLNDDLDCHRSIKGSVEY